MKTTKYIAGLMLTAIVGTASAQDVPPKGCILTEDKMGRGEIRQCAFDSTNRLSRLVIENRNGKLEAYINFRTMLRNHETATIRWDEERAVNTGMSRSNNFEALFFFNATSAITKIGNSKRLMVESDTYARGVNVDTFNLDGAKEMASFVLKQKLTQTPTPTPTSQPDPLVQRLQAALNGRGINAGTADGVMGAQTKAAIIAAQSLFGLPTDGVPSEALLAKLQGAAKPTQTQGYGASIKDCLVANLAFPTPPRSGSANPASVYRAQLKQDGTVEAVNLVRGSGNPAFDRAVESAIRRCSPLPLPPSGKYPGFVDISHSMY